MQKMRRLLKSKKAYMFTIDLIIAIIALLIGLALIYYKFSSVNKNIYFTEQISEDIIGVLAYTSTHDLCLNLGNASTCTCPRYQNLSQVVCGGLLQDRDTNILSMISEMIETGAYSGDSVKSIINEIFIAKNVIDEKRFGFALLYTSLITSPDTPLELFNSETFNSP
jgi:hypothetical protein